MNWQHIVGIYRGWRKDVHWVSDTPCLLELSHDPSLDELVGRVADQTLDSSSHQNYRATIKD
jgi:hypothetical protein